MSLLNKILPQKESKEYFLTVAVEENRIIATVSLISGKDVTIIGTGQSEFEETSEETEAADIAISAAEKKIGEDILVQKVIFGLPVSLLDEDKIKPQHLTRLKKITKTLSLVPCGFIEYPQALSYYLETKEESPPTLLLLSIGTKQITFSHIRVGKIEKNIVVEKTSSVTSDFEKALLSFSSSEILPSRIILYDESGDTRLNETSEELLKFPWHKHSTFLHTPKVETLESEALTYALVEAAARSLAHDLALGDENETKPEPEKKEVETETFGFVKDKDIAEETTEVKTEKEQGTYTESKEPEKLKVKNILITEEQIEKQPVESALIKLPRFNFDLPKLSFKKLPILGVGIIIILLLILLFTIFWYYPKAAVNLIVYPASNTSQINVLFTTNSSNTGKNTILVTSISEEVSGDKTAAATGKTQIGEKAKGTVTLYNKTLVSKTFPKGTVLSGDNLNFTLNDDVTIASSSDTGEGLTFGKTTANITAVNIGPEGNLAAGTNFAFKDFTQSSYYGKNNDKLTGGTSRDITSVSKEDQDKLLSSLTEELVQRAKQIMKQKLGSREQLLDVSLDNTVTSKKFSPNAGEEAQELSLSLSLKISGFIYKETDLTSLASAGTTSVPSGFSIASDKTRILITEAKTDKNGDVVGKATITYFFFPNIETEKIKNEIAGKDFKQIDKYLSTIQNIGGVEIITDTKLPFIADKLPARRENINITLVSR